MNFLSKLLLLPKLAVCYAYDAWRFSRAAHLFGPFKSRDASRAHLMRLAHSLEKGMALATPRRGFGHGLTAHCLADVESYVERFGPDDFSLIILSIVRATISFHASLGVEWPDHASLTGRLEMLHNGVSERVFKAECGAVPIKRSSVQESLPPNAENFFTSRRSVRQFAPEPITRAEIERAVRMAQRAPSVCNRQRGRVYAYTNSEERAHVLSFQDGNAGFGDQASVVFVVTCDLTIFYKNGERNQGFVDGGLFAMSLVLALHAMGFGSCLLNWSRGPKEDFRFRNQLGIPDSQVIITLLAAGRLLPEFTVAASPRRPLEEVLVGVALDEGLMTIEHFCLE